MLNILLRINYIIHYFAVAMHAFGVVIIMKNNYYTMSMQYNHGRVC